MNETRYGLLAIGAFATAAQLTLKALRLYDRLGLLPPRYVDPESGYRYYDMRQLHDARLIRVMRQLDMPLEEIRRVLAAAPKQAEQLVQDYWREQERRLEQGRQAVRDLTAYLRKEATPMGIDVIVRELAPQQVVSIKGRVRVDRLDSFIRSSLERIDELIAAQGAASTGAPFGIFHGPINHEDDGPIEVCVPVSGALAVVGEARLKTLPGGRFASVTIRGDQCEFPAILEAYDAASQWIERHGFIMAEPPREIWHTPAGPQAKMEIAWRFIEHAVDLKAWEDHATPTDDREQATMDDQMALNMTRPRLEQREEQPYAAARTRVKFHSNWGQEVLPRLWDEVVGWLGERGQASAGAPFIRYLVIDMEGELEIEVGWPTASVLEGDERIITGALPAGRYAVTVHSGPYDLLVAATGALLAWAEHNGVAWQVDGNDWRSRLESYLTDPTEEPDPAKWETELAFLTA